MPSRGLAGVGLAGARLEVQSVSARVAFRVSRCSIHGYMYAYLHTRTHTHTRTHIHTHVCCVCM